MGCDIHAYVEFRQRDAKRWDGETPSFSGWPRINPGRYYQIFARLTNGEVRTEDDLALGLKPKGYPADASYWTDNDYFEYITEGETFENYVTLETAQRYAQHGSVLQERDGKPWRVTGPDWHTPSWVTSDEWAKAIGDGAAPEYCAILAALRSFESHGYETRVVFWFDN